MLQRVLTGLYRMFLLLRLMQWRKLFRLYNGQATVVLWIPRKGLMYFFSDGVIWDVATINAFCSANISFKIYYGNKIGSLHNRKIFHTINNRLNLFGFADYTSIYHHLLQQLEAQGNQLYPNLWEVKFWENKAFMYEEFKRLNIPTPVTEIFRVRDDVNTASFAYPFLIKKEHSYSSIGLYLIHSKADWDARVSDEKFRRENQHIIKQDLVNMRSDLRVILIGGKIVHFYWRKNKSAEWMPTSTSYGSVVDFENFPEQWRKHIIDTFESLQIAAGAFDITWQNDDLNTTPLYLEVSPVFQPNPNIKIAANREYADYKKSLSPFNIYNRAFVRLIFELKQKQVIHYFQQ
jgi:RimK-like ATP-grasp domain